MCIRDSFKEYSRLSSTSVTSMSFDQIAQESALINMEEFTRFMYHYQFVPFVYNRSELSQLFMSHIVDCPGQGLTADEFARCVGHCVTAADSKYASSGKRRNVLPQPIVALGKMLANVV
eukprot:TRINITY_DN25265_c0_g1_i1.p1 TRINITY_DN25265_c0_g1~~TRINITY_DN25265_c0_g1_i1.p1  ORF type:complete len:135 (-),score=31.61 TRINITY_DN25265_c0_g1_i1:67-423(-)